MRALALFAGAVCLLSTIRSPSVAETFVEDFTTTTYCDTARTTASWDTGSGKLTLHPYRMEVLASFPMQEEEAVREFAIDGDYAYLAVDQGGFQVVDIHDPLAMSKVGEIRSIEFSSGIDIDGDVAYVAALSDLVAIDIRDPRAPAIASRIPVEEATDVRVAGDFAFVAAGNTGFVTVDVADPWNPAIAGIVDTPGYASSLVLYGDVAYVCDGYHGLAVIDIRDPRAPLLIERIAMPNEPARVTVAGGYAYVAETSSELLVYSLADPAHPAQVGACALPGHAMDVEIEGHLAYVPVGDNQTTGFFVVDVSDPAAPFLVGGIRPPGFPIRVAIEGDHAFLGCFDAGLQFVRIADRIDPICIESGEDLWHVQDLQVDGDLMTMLCHIHQSPYVLTYSIAQPGSPRRLGSLAMSGYPLEFVSTGGYLYAADGERGLEVVDLRDPANPALVTTLLSADCYAKIAIAGDFLFIGVLASPASYLLVVNVSDPARPRIAGRLDLQTTPHAMVLSGNHLFVAEYEDGQNGGNAGGDRKAARRSALRLGSTIETIDVSDPLHPFSAATFRVEEDMIVSMTIEGDVLYASFWTFMSAAGNGVQLYDISDPLQMRPLGRFDGSVQYGGRLCVSGDVAYLPVSQNNRLDVLDVSDPTALRLLTSLYLPDEGGLAARAGDYLYVSGAWARLSILHVSNRIADAGRNVAQSTVLPASGRNARWVRIEATADPSVDWWFSADGGRAWQAVPGDGRWKAILSPGHEPVWRAVLRYSEPFRPPSVDRVAITWIDPEPAHMNGPGTPARVALRRNGPNPFRLSAGIAFDLPQPCRARLDVIDAAGRLVSELLDADLPAGSHDAVWRGRDRAGRPAASGIYFLRLRADGTERTCKIILQAP